MEANELERLAAAVPPEDVWPTLREVLPFLASPDPRLRDELAFGILSSWVYERDLLGPEGLQEMLTFALSERGIRRGLGESGTDTVFGRSFAALVIALAVVVDNRRPYLSELEYERVLAALVDYAASERDLRGFVPTKGWAHAPAHLADALGECVLSRYATTETARSATKALCSLVSRANEVFTGDEDERIAIAIGAAVEQRGLALDEVTTHVRAVAPSDSNRIARINRKLLARSLYFRLGRADELLRLAQWETDNASKRVIP